MANVNLLALRNKVRRLSRVPTAAQVSDADINNYIDLALLYDFPGHVKLFTLRKTFTFYTQPNVDTYTTNTLNAQSPMFNFKNLILQSSDPVYIGGYPASFSQSRTEFFIQWPMVQTREKIGTGDGVEDVFAGTLTGKPILHENVQMSSINALGRSTAVTAVPVVHANGNQTQDGNFYDVNGPIPTVNPTVLDVTNSISYVDGDYTVTFPTAPASGQPIYSSGVQYAAGRPTSVLFFNNTFTIRQVPDGTYPVTIEAQVRPTSILGDDANVPELEQWFEFIAYLAAKKVCEDRNDMETIQILMPSLEEQKTLVERRTLIQQGDKRSATIYTLQSGLSGVRGPWNNGW